MIIRVANHFFNLEDIFNVEFTTLDEGLQAKVALNRNDEIKSLEFSNGPAEYLQTVLDAQHFITVQKIRDSMPVEPS